MRDALAEEKYKDLGIAFSENGFDIRSILYNDENADTLISELADFDVVLVWVNPVEQGRDRKKLDKMLGELSSRGCFVSAHPGTILKMGTKDVLYKTKDMLWGSDTEIYADFNDFTTRFPAILSASGIRVLKQYRGNGGDGVFKIINKPGQEQVSVVHAKKGEPVRDFSIKEFFLEFESFFLNDGLLIDQPWNKNITNGMVRCYLSGTTVAGFGYQEINALYESKNLPDTYIPPGKRFYFTENCGLFQDMRNTMESIWVPQLLDKLEMEPEMLPVIWDADFFINDPFTKSVPEKYTLCEINVSSVSPFPPSAIKFMVDNIRNRFNK